MSTNEVKNDESENKACVENSSAESKKRSSNDYSAENPSKKSCGDLTKTILMGGGEGMKQLEEYLSFKSKPAELHSQYIHKPR